MERYRIVTPYGTTYEIDKDGCFLRYDDNQWEHEHDTWKCTGIAELKPFGHLRFIGLGEFIKMMEGNAKFTFKNGKPRFTLTDLDHGTNRVHGNTEHHGIKYAYKM